MFGDKISIEKVLNSRCSSSLPSRDRKNHWGTLANSKPPKKIISHIIRCCNIPRYSNGKLMHWFNKDYLFLGFEKPNNAYTERILHIESGMQHQAVYLACTALGIGTCIHNQGINGTHYGEKIATARHIIRETSNPYESGKFTVKPPGSEKAFIIDEELTEPIRDSNIECLPHLENLVAYEKSGFSVTKKSVSQLLWAGKGRTPHCIRTHICNDLWGLTIPTWAGGQDYTTIYLVKNANIFRYINWTKDFSLINRVLLHYAKWTRGSPSHKLRYIEKIGNYASLDDVDTAIIICRNEETNRALWECGYILENMLLQTRSLGITYKSKIFTNEEIKKLRIEKISEPVAALIL